MEAYDATLDDDQNIGTYAIARGNASSGSTRWDILPVELDPSAADATTGEGRIDISRDGEDELGSVSIAQWSRLSGASSSSSSGASSSSSSGASSSSSSGGSSSSSGGRPPR